MANKGKDRLKVILTVGIPGSGKSTWAKEHIKKNPNFVRVSRDDFRRMLKDQDFCEPNIEDLITKISKEVVVKALHKKQSVILDNTHVKESNIHSVIEWVNHMADVEFMVFDVPKDKCIERDSLRDRKVGTNVIEKMDENFKILKDTFVFQPVPMDRSKRILVPDFKNTLPPAVAFDIDGTLAHMTNQRGPFDWNKVDMDDFSPIVGEQIAFYKSLGRTVIILSGRDSSCRKLTEEWLKFYGITYDHLFMRPEGDNRRDDLIKEEIYETQIKGKYNLLAVWDDRKQVVEMWYRKKIFCINVNQGNLEY